MKAFLFALLVATATAIPLPDDSGPVDVVVNGVPEGEALEIAHLLDVNVNEKVNGEVVSSASVLHPFSAQGLAEAAAIAEEPVAEQTQVAPSPVELPTPILPEVVEIIELPVEQPTPVEPGVIPSPIELPTPAQPDVIPSPIELPTPAQPDVVPSPIELPTIAQPDVVPPVELPTPVQPGVIPSPIELPTPTQPEVIPSPIELPSPTQPEVVEVLSPVVSEVQPVQVVEVAENLPSPTLLQHPLITIQTNLQDSGVLTTLSNWVSLFVNYVTGTQVNQTTQIIQN